MSNRSLTVVLPVYNGEMRLTNCVHQVLDLASELTSQFSILIIDDGSTDDTSAVARELSAQFPQIAVRRHRNRRGLGPIVDMVQRRVSSDVVIVHDGVTPIDPSQVRRLWQQNIHHPSAPAPRAKCDASEVAQLRATHTAMAKAHERVMGFHLLPPARVDETSTVEPMVPPAGVHSPSRLRPSERSSVGQIPPLPRPNFLSAMAEFAFGE